MTMNARPMNTRPMNARAVMVEVLTKIYLEGAYSHLVLKHTLDVEHMSVSEKGLITNVVYGTIQNHLYVRALWRQFVSRKVKDPVIEILLDMSVYQLMFLDRVPAYAVVNEAVELAKKRGKSYAPFVNGVLQALLRSDKTLVVEGEIEELALLSSHPQWLVQMWIKHYGLEATKRICLLNNIPPRACARVNTLHTSKAELMKLYACTAGSLSEDALYFEEPITSTLAFQVGEISIQDEGSQMVAIIANPQPQDRVLDVCAAPGSKTIHMASRMKNQGTIIAQELHEHRSNLILQGCEKLGIDIVEVKTVDSTTSHLLYKPSSFDVVLVDAPCSGFGVLRRKPDIKFRAKQEDMDGLLVLQKELLESVSSLVRIEGHLVYSTCTLNKKENERQIAEFLLRHEEYELVEERTIMPFDHDCDGFYIAKLIRKK